MSKLTLHLIDSHRFSVVGTNWTARLKEWAKVPKGHLLLDAESEGEDTSTTIQMLCFLDCDNTLNFKGDWQSVNNQ